MNGDGESRRLDPRIYQSAVLAGLLAYGLVALRFEIRATQVAITLASALATQWIVDRLAKRPFDPRSALISALSLCLLLRTGAPWLAAVASAIAIGSKLLIRCRGKHVFNPTNLALVVMLATHAGWVSPGQWGNVALFAFLMCCLGGLVVTRAARADVTLAFIAGYAGILIGYATWLGQPLAVPLHRLENGAFLLFSFFMISDPKTTPDSRAGRVLFALLVAAGAAFVPLVLYRNNGLLWSLAVFSPLVPLLDRVLPGRRYAWTRVSVPPSLSKGESFHERGAPVQPAVPHPAVASGRS